MNLFFRLFLTFNSTSILLVIYLVKSQTILGNTVPFLFHLPHLVVYVIYFLIPVLLTLLSLFISKYLGKDSIEVQSGVAPIINIEQANNAFLPSYLGYFFVALGVPNFESLIFVFAIIYLFTFFSQSLYFNPIFLIFGYHFFNLTTRNNVKIFLITRKEIKDPKELNLPVVRRINDFTFIDAQK